MRRKTDLDGYRVGGRLVAAIASALVAFCVTWQVLKPAPTTQPELTTIVRERGLFATEVAQQELAIGQLVSPENLVSAISEAQFQMSGPVGSSAESIQAVRDRLRVDVSAPDKAGVQTMTVRWVGNASTSAAQLLNMLARRFVTQVASRDAGAYEASHAAARQALTEASRAVDDARHELESVVAAARVPRRESPAVSPTHSPTHAPRLAPRPEPDRDAWGLLGQQLTELESRRQALAERLMPEHPEMVALDEKIATLRTRLGNAFQAEANNASIAEPTPTRAAVPDFTPQEAPMTSEIVRWGEELATAQKRYASAAERERASWEALCSARNRLVAEIEPAMFSPVAVLPSWPRWFVSLLTAAVCGLLMQVVWPRRKLTFSTAEEVRAATHLPVVIVSRASLN
jgi:hypothetical protein